MLGSVALFRQPITPTAHYSDNPLLRQPITIDHNIQPATTYHVISDDDDFQLTTSNQNLSTVPTTDSDDEFQPVNTSVAVKSRTSTTMQNRTQSTNPWFNQVYPTGCSVGQANLDGPWPRQNVLERKRSFYPRLYTRTRELSTYLRSFFHSSACTLCSLSLLFYYICPSSILNVKICTFSLHAKNSIITVVTYAN
jgi:hypothetical protein